MVRADPHVDVHPASAAGLGEADHAQLVERGPQDVQGDGPGLVEPGAGLRVQVDPQLVGVVGVGAAGVPRVQRDGSHLCGPDDVGGTRHAQRLGAAPRREGHVAGLDPVGRTFRQPFLVDLVALDPVREALQVGGPVAQGRQDGTAGVGGHRPVVVRDVTFGAALGAERGEHHAVAAGQPHGHAVDVDRLCGRGHARSLARSPDGDQAGGCRSGGRGADWRPCSYL